MECVGAWGTAVFSNDTSADVRVEFRDLIADGLSSEAASAKVITDNAVPVPPHADPDVAADFWVGLALAQHELGRLQPEVHRAALLAAADPRELERWKPADRAKRKAALDRAVQKLEQPQKPPRRPRKRPQVTTDLEIGQYLVFTTPQQRRVLLCVRRVSEDQGGRYPVVVLLDWEGVAQLPRDLATVRAARDPRPRARQDEAMGFTLIGSPGDPDGLLLLPAARRSRLPWRQSDYDRPRWVSEWITTWTEIDRFIDDSGRPRVPDWRGSGTKGQPGAPAALPA